MYMYPGARSQVYTWVPGYGPSRIFVCCIAPWWPPPKFKTEEYEVYNTVYTDDIDLLHALESNYDYKNIYSPLSEEHEKLLKTSKDNKVIIRDKLWYNKFRYKIEVYRNWRDRNYVEKTLEEAHEFILKTFDPSTSKTRRWSHYNSYSIPNVYTNDINSIMLLKLAYNDTLRIQVVEVTKINELK